MKAIVKTAIVAASAALIASVGSSGWAQQPGTTPAPQTTPAQPVPGMGQQQMQRGMEHDKVGQGMGRQMEQRGRQQGGEHAPMGPGMMQQQPPGTAQQPSQGTPPTTTR